jgi:hypothetical protein
MSGGWVSAQDDAFGRSATLREAVSEQFRRAFRPPYEGPTVVAVNGLCMTGAWFLLPNPNPLFTFHGALAFPIVLAGWMFSDVPATNVLGSDAKASITGLQEPRSLFRLILAKNIVLWTLIAPLCAVIAVVLGLRENRPTATIFTLVWILVMAWGVLPLAAWAGIYYPYHPIALRERWRHRREFKQMILRWGVLAVLPYILVPTLAVIISAPTLLLWYLTSQTGGWTRIPDGDFALGVLVGCGLAAVTCLWGYRRGVRIAEKRKPDLIRYLADPGRG